jgi:2-polyprenyl-6-methoxyphenol hydroxylase-like FAD-dependent oxidoreductase
MNVVPREDAAHAPSSHQGSGTSMAIEDSLIMRYLSGLNACDKRNRKAFAAHE